jgi:hypothetical protein
MADNAGLSIQLVCLQLCIISILINPQCKGKEVSGDARLTGEQKVIVKRDTEQYGKIVFPWLSL